MSDETKDLLTADEREALRGVEMALDGGGYGIVFRSRVRIIAEALKRLAPEPARWVDCTFGEAMVAHEAGARVRSRGVVWIDGVNISGELSAIKHLHWQRLVKP